MADRIMSGFSRTNHIKLPEETTTIDTSTVLGASAYGAILKANKTGNYENVGNVLTLYKSIKEVDSSNDKEDRFIRSSNTVTVLTDANGGEHRLTDSAMVIAYTDKGMTISKTITKHTWSDGVITEE